MTTFTMNTFNTVNDNRFANTTAPFRMNDAFITVVANDDYCGEQGHNNIQPEWTIRTS